MKKYRIKVKRKPLQHTISLTMVTGAVALLLMACVVVLLLYPYTILKGLKGSTANNLEFVLTISDREYLEDLFLRTEEIYHDMPEEIKSDPFSDEFISFFLPLTAEEGYIRLKTILDDCRRVQNLYTIAFCFYDKENGRIVFVVDGNKDEKSRIPGQWISTEKKPIRQQNEIERIINSDWYMGMSFDKNTGWMITNYVAIQSKDGKVQGLAYTDIKINDFLTSMGAFTIIYLFLMLVTMVVMVGFLSNYLRTRIVEPIGRLSRAAVAYTARDKTVIEDNDTYFRPLDISTGDEIETLWKSLSDMETDMNDTMIRIREMTSAQERYATELSIASQIQSDMLPGRFPPFPDRHEFELFAMMTPARQVGGDFYDFFFTDHDHLALVIADVSDKGVPAALFMMTARTLIKNHAKLNASPSEILSFANAELCEGNELGLFVTVWMTIIELSTGNGVAVNAGHTHPVLCRSGGSYALVEYDHSLPLGVSGDTDFSQHVFHMDRNDRLFVYTDGVTDASDVNDRSFGTEGMLKALNETGDFSAEDVLKHVMHAIEEFSGGAEQTDDITMLGFYYNGYEV